MKVTHVYTGADDCSHFRDLELHMDVSGLGSTSVPAAAVSVLFRDTAGGPTHSPFRPAPRRQLVVLLQGRVEYSVGDGSTREFGIGDIVFFDDTHGQGHRARVLKDPRIQAFVRLDDGFELDAWAAPAADAQTILTKESM